MYKRILRPILFLFSPERIHHLTFAILNTSSLIPGFFSLFFGSRRIRNKDVEVMGLNFTNPVGLAAGLDKNGVAMRPMSKIGFGFLELGTVTPKPQDGNPKPRLFRLPKDQALINRMGFNNRGVDELARKLKKRPGNVIIGGNIGKNTLTPNEHAVEDYAYCFERLLGLVDYFVVNVSCPNISDLRELQDRESLTDILNRLLEIRKKEKSNVPILLKVSPDLNDHQIIDTISVINTTGIDGLVATNTSVGRANIKHSAEKIERIGNGGLSGKPLSKASTDMIKKLREALPKPFPIIASGGIMSPDDALEKIEAGADLVQLYTGFVYEGPGLIRKILDRL